MDEGTSKANVDHFVTSSDPQTSKSQTPKKQLKQRQGDHSDSSQQYEGGRMLNLFLGHIMF